MALSSGRDASPRHCRRFVRPRRARRAPGNDPCGDSARDSLWALDLRRGRPKSTNLLGRVPHRFDPRIRRLGRCGCAPGHRDGWVVLHGKLRADGSQWPARGRPRAHLDALLDAFCPSEAHLWFQRVRASDRVASVFSLAGRLTNAVQSCGRTCWRKRSIKAVVIWPPGPRRT
jgi:hypothetical protein